MFDDLQGVRSVRAELGKAVRRPALWLLPAVGVTLSVTFAYLIPYAGYAGGTEGPPNSDRGLAAMLPAEFVGSAIAGTPVFVGALALILGVLVVGGEYQTETWKTLLSQGPGRRTVYGAKVVTVAAGVLALTLALFAAAALASVVVAALQGQPMMWPPLSEIAAGLGAGWLITMMWAASGIMLAVVLRGVALPIGLGLVWLLAVQNLISAIAAPLVDWIADLQHALPGPNAGSLVASLGAATTTPGVTALVDGGQATLVTAGYLVVFLAVGGWLLSSRDMG
ncbi:ABC-type transport system involved in multi-copper enzyme maturation, permease component [Amycolatopsis marina]|uniref:ABC-type transport system involved in multi-copper enzyme maturation, permease component n=1 Tax=Amycolatopsis marina TaxID=490629 RepID=A0A1I1B265_9PSEU|nr:ABC transporter permease subunit [Amycolatopsis marina]SFB44449.1 ABC-type transport system involved in multi-copper enzyme maturation, permease component [Amycolatopsis marina]